MDRHSIFSLLSSSLFVLKVLQDNSISYKSKFHLSKCSHLVRFSRTIPVSDWGLLYYNAQRHTNGTFSEKKKSSSINPLGPDSPT